MIATCVAGGARDVFARERQAAPPKTAPRRLARSRNQSNTPLIFSTNNDAIGNPAATGMLGHAVMPPHDVVMLSHALSCWAMPPCCVKDDGDTGFGSSRIVIFARCMPDSSDR